MLCDKLKIYRTHTDNLGDNYIDAEFVDVVLKEDVDATIAELKDKCQMHDFFWEGCGFAKRGFKNTIAVSEAFDRLEAENAELKQKLENVQASMYCDVVDANMKVRRLKRALYKACANWALSTLAWLDCVDQGEPRKWSEMRQNCLKKAEEYK